MEPMSGDVEAEALITSLTNEIQSYLQNCWLIDAQHWPYSRLGP